MELEATNEKPPKQVEEALHRILGTFWDMVLDDFQARTRYQPSVCHAGHLFVSMVDVAGWLEGKELYPMDFVIADFSDGETINLMEEKI